VIFSSPLGRALQTARIIADVVAVESSIVVDPDLMEIGMGSAEGMTQSDMEQRWPALKAIPASETMSLKATPNNYRVKAVWGK
jgi:broad specificity phosphatase PhoE